MITKHRLPIGQLLVRLLFHFRQEILVVAADRGFGDIRPAHLQIFGNIDLHGVRLTALASRAHLSNTATSELVDDLQRRGYLERRRDPTDRRAKLIFPTVRGRAALAVAIKRVGEIEAHWAGLVGSNKFDTMCRSLDRLVAKLHEENGPTADR